MITFYYINQNLLTPTFISGSSFDWNFSKDFLIHTVDSMELILNSVADNDMQTWKNNANSEFT